MSAAPVVSLTLCTPLGNDRAVEFPARFEVCERCHGTGSHVNPAIDGNGLSAEDFEREGDDFREDYFAGVYDVACYSCGGLRVVPRVDESRLTKYQRAKLALFDRQQESVRESYREQEAERRMGA